MSAALVLSGSVEREEGSTESVWAREKGRTTTKGVFFATEQQVRKIDRERERDSCVKSNGRGVVIEGEINCIRNGTYYYDFAWF